jgi:hypothetical protein
MASERCGVMAILAEVLLKKLLVNGPAVSHANAEPHGQPPLLATAPFAGN